MKRLFETGLILIVLLSACATGTGHSTNSEPEYRTIESKTACVITFNNRTSEVRVVNWMNREGEPVTYARLDSKQQVTINTFLTHPWQITDETGTVITYYMPAEGHRIIDLNE